MTLLLARERHLLLVSGLLFTLLATLWAAPPEIYPVSALLAMLLLALLGGLLLRSGWLPSRNDLRFLACLGFPLLLSHVLAVNHGGSVESLVRILGTLLLFAVARELPWRVAAAVLILLVAGGTVLALHGLWQYFFGFDLILDAGSLAPAAAQRLGTYRVFSRFLLPSVLASFLILALPVAGGLVMHSSQGLHRIFACLAAAAMGAALLLTGSHGALLAILAAGLLAWRPLRGRRLGLAAGVLMATVTGLVLVFFLRGGVLLAGVEGEGPAALRWRNNVAASRMLVDHPLAGVGGGGFGSVYPSYLRPGDNETRFVHNAYLQLLVEHGLPMALPLGILLLGWVGTLRACRRAGKPLLGAAALGLTAFLLHSFVDVGFLLPSTLWTAAVLAGLLVAQSRPSRPDAAFSSGASDGRGLTPPLMIKGGLVLILVAGWVAGTGTALSRRALAAARLSLEEGHLTTGYSRACRAERRAPWRADAPLLQAEILLRAPDLLGDALKGRQAAAAAAARALQHDRAWPAAHRTQALARLALGDAGGAASHLWQAAVLYPQAAHYREDLQALGRQISQRTAETP